VISPYRQAKHRAHAHVYTSSSSDCLPMPAVYRVGGGMRGVLAVFAEAAVQEGREELVVDA
jgi:hypothetical protein